MEMIKLTMAAARTNAGLTQAEIAEIIGVSRVSVNKWENGVFTPSARHMQKFCEAVNLPAELILVPGR